jgi:PKD repeat protein
MWSRFSPRRFLGAVAHAFAFGRSRRVRSGLQAPSPRPNLEALEDRTMLDIALTSFVVPPAGRVGQTLSFSAAATETDGSPLLYNWNFGDGTTQQGATVTHAYGSATQPGQPLTVKLQVTSQEPDGTVPDGLEEDAFIDIGEKPTVDLSASRTTVAPGGTVGFAADVTDLAGPDDIAAVEWDFNYNGWAFQPDAAESGDLAPLHTFTAPGTPTVAVRVTDQSGDQSLATLQLTVSGPPEFTSDPAATFVLGQYNTFQMTTAALPVAAFSTAGDLPDGVSLTDNNDGTATLSGTPTGPVGDYALTLTAANALGSTDQGFTLTVANFLDNPGDQTSREGDTVAL